uniref:Fibrinogen C-terminal domain-containing protein n=1 Tax=Plectus sambesii TaxID=2011161 RepID=A0A914UQQ7_9BILA
MKLLCNLDPYLRPPLKQCKQNIIKNLKEASPPVQTQILTKCHSAINENFTAAQIQRKAKKQSNSTTKKYRRNIILISAVVFVMFAAIFATVFILFQKDRSTGPPNGNFNETTSVIPTDGSTSSASETRASVNTATTSLLITTTNQQNPESTFTVTSTIPKPTTISAETSTTPKPSTTSTVTSNTPKPATSSTETSATPKLLANLTESPTTSKLTTTYTGISSTPKPATTAAETSTTPKVTTSSTVTTTTPKPTTSTETYSSQSTVSPRKCPAGWFSSGGSQNACYYVAVQKKKWLDAEDFCTNAGPNSHLISIATDFDNCNVDAAVSSMSFFSNCSQFWLGGHYIALNGRFIWMDGSPWSYSNWCPGQPDINQTCVSSAVRTTGCWRTEPCENENCFICLMNIKTDCKDWFNHGAHTDGIYPINPDGRGSFNVFCDMTTDGGGWTVFQRRIDDSLSFYDRLWYDYKVGFNNGLENNLWLGNEIIHILSTKDSNVELRIELRGDRNPSSSYPNGYWWEKRTNFFIDDETHFFTLHLSSLYAGNATMVPGYGISYSKGLNFSTLDFYNGADPNCHSRLYRYTQYPLERLSRREARSALLARCRDATLVHSLMRRVEHRPACREGLSPVHSQHSCYQFPDPRRDEHLGWVRGRPQRESNPRPRDW